MLGGVVVWLQNDIYIVLIHVDVGQVDSMWRWFAWDGLHDWPQTAIAVGVVRLVEMGMADGCSW